MEKKEHTYWVKIEIAGDYHVAKQVCREFCMDEGACVQVHLVDYVYTGGEESGVSVMFVNYPRFPKDSDEIYRQAKRLALKLRDRMCQWSVMLITPTTTTWLTAREERENG